MRNHRNGNSGNGGEPAVYRTNTAETMSIPPRSFRDCDRYKNDLFEPLARINIPSEDVRRVEVEPIKERGMMRRANLFLVRLYDHNDEVIGRLFGKSVYDGQRLYNVSEQVIPSRNNLEYQQKQMTIWGNLNLPAPRLIDYVRETRRIGYGSKKLEGLLMEEVRAPTHDITLLAIMQKIGNYRGHMDDRFVDLSDDERAGVVGQIKKLENLRLEILISAMETVYDFAVFGTPHVDLRDVARPRDPLRFHLKKLKHYMQQFVIWDAIDKGELTAKQARGSKRRIRRIGKLGEHIHSIKKDREFLELMRQIMEGNIVYRQGDEFLHHAAYHRVIGDPINPDPFIVRTVLFDADRATLSSLAGAQAKLLFNPIANVSYDGATVILKRATDYAKMRLEAGIREGVLEESTREMIDWDEERLRRNLDFTGIFEIMRCLGRRAQDALKNLEFHNQGASRLVQHKNPYIDDAEYGLELPVDIANGYNIPKSIQRLRDSLDELFRRVREKNVEYEVADSQRKSVEKLEVLVRSNGILPKE